MRSFFEKLTDPQYRFIRNLELLELSLFVIIGTRIWDSFSISAIDSMILPDSKSLIGSISSCFWTLTGLIDSWTSFPVISIQYLDAHCEGWDGGGGWLGILMLIIIIINIIILTWESGDGERWTEGRGGGGGELLYSTVELTC